MSDCQIIACLSTKMGYPMNYDSPEQIMEEIARLTPVYGGISYSRLDKEGLQWPCLDKGHPGTKFLHKDKFVIGRGKFAVIDYVTPKVSPDTGVLSILTPVIALCDSGTGTMARRSGGLRYLMAMSAKTEVEK